MSAIKTLEGHCLCGAVTLRAAINHSQVGACHCATCRRWGGGPLLAIESDQPVAFDGAQQISVYASSDWAERGFCKECGTHLFYRLLEKNIKFFGGRRFLASSNASRIKSYVLLSALR